MASDLVRRGATGAGLLLMVTATLNAQGLTQQMRLSDLVVVADVGAARSVGTADVYPFSVTEVLKGTPGPLLQVWMPKKVALHVQPPANESAILCLNVAPPQDGQPVGYLLRQGPSAVIDLTAVDPGPILDVARGLVRADRPPIELASTLVAHTIEGHPLARREASAALLERRDLWAHVDARMRGLLVQALDREEKDAGFAGLLAGLLCDFGIPNLIEVLIPSFLKIGDAGYAELCGRIALKLDAERGIARLGKALDEVKEPGRQVLLLRALAATEVEAAVPHLVKRAGDAALRGNVAAALARNDTPAAFDELRRLAYAPAEADALVVVKAIAKVTTRRARALLAEIARDHRLGSVRDAAVGK